MAVNNAYGVMPRPKKSEHYVNNKDFLNALELYFAQVARAKLNDQPKPPIPRYIGECFLKIANHLSYKPNFVNYMFKDDMICDGIENCVRYVHNFNPEKSKNPFAYFTQIIYYAFLRRIAKEKKLLYTKQKMYTSMAVMGELYDDASGTDLSNSQSSYATDYMNDFVDEYEKNLEKKKVPKVKKRSGVELFYDEEDE